MPSDSGLGKPTAYPNRYSPALLDPIARADSRDALGIDSCEPLPFRGVDIWNAWELTWLGENGLPRVATAEFRIPADSDSIVESKSLKLYLNSFSMSRFASPDRVATLIARDLDACIGATTDVVLDTDLSVRDHEAADLRGRNIDDPNVVCDTYDVDASLLSANPSDEVEESLHSHVLRSLCPVTSQPDIGSVEVDYAGPRIDPAALLRYIVSFRNHNDFHEACVERMFLDIREHCAPQRLSVYARYQRRGGIDINPFRSTEKGEPDNQRLWRQ